MDLYRYQIYVYFCEKQDLCDFSKQCQGSESWKNSSYFEGFIVCVLYAYIVVEHEKNISQATGETFWGEFTGQCGYDIENHVWYIC